VFSITRKLIFRILPEDREISSFLSISCALFAKNTRVYRLSAFENRGPSPFATAAVFQDGNCFETFAPLTPEFATLTTNTGVEAPAFSLIPYFHTSLLSSPL